MNASTIPLARRIAALALGATVFTGGLTLAAGPASADVVTGQFVHKGGMHCGGQERITGSNDIFGVTFKQHAWIYYNCGNRTVFRKADVINAFDGDCHGIGPGQARVLHAKSSVFDRVYRGSKPCP